MTTGPDFSGQNLQNHNFAGMDLTGANFAGANLQGAIFDGAELANANFSTPGHTTNLSGASFIGADLTNADFTGVNLQGANLDPPNAKGPLSANRLTPQSDKQTPGASSGSQNVASSSKGSPGAGLNPNGQPGSAAGAKPGQNAHWQTSAIGGSAVNPEHTWNGHSQKGAFDRYTLPANVTGTAVLSNKPLPTPSAGAQVHTGGFTRYVVSGNNGNAQVGKGTPQPQSARGLSLQRLRQL